MSVMVLFSGGLDSTTVLARAVEEYGAEEVIALSLYYGQRHDKELRCARQIAKRYRVKRYTLDVGRIFKASGCALLKGRADRVKDGSYAEQIGDAGYVSTYVPYRNGLFLSIATAMALSMGCEAIYYGAHRDDAAGAAYPDCSAEFNEAITQAIYQGSGGKIRLVAPFIDANKKDIVAEGLRLDVPYELTWSCYKGGRKPCGRCGTCIDRIQAFKENGKDDPLCYK